MLNIEIITIFSLKKSIIKELILDYEKRLRPFAKIKFSEIKASAFQESNGSKLKALKQDEESLETYLSKSLSKNIYLLSEAGNLYNSLALTNFLYRYEAKPLILVIGNTLGFSLALKAKYPLVSLSPLTLTHELAELFLMEQIYRSVCIYNKKKYHY